MNKNNLFLVVSSLRSRPVLIRHLNINWFVLRYKQYRNSIYASSFPFLRWNDESDPSIENFSIFDLHARDELVHWTSSYVRRNCCSRLDLWQLGHLCILHLLLPFHLVEADSSTNNDRCWYRAKIHKGMAPQLNIFSLFVYTGKPHILLRLLNK